MRPVANRNLCLDVDIAASRLIFYGCHNGPNQSFFTRTYGPQRFNNLCLDVEAGGKPVVMRACNNSRGQRWAVVAEYAGSGVTLKNEQGWCLQPPDGVFPRQGLQVIAWICYGGQNQMFAMAPVQTASTPANGRTGECSNPQITAAIKFVMGRPPANGGATGECDPAKYGNWSSTRDLENKVTVKLTGKGVAYVFDAPRMAGVQGHVGWAYLMPNGRYTYGSTIAGGARPHIDAGPDTNDPWMTGKIGDMFRIALQADTEKELFAAFYGLYPPTFPFYGYTEYKRTFTASRNIDAAYQMQEKVRKAGYDVFGNNCADHTYWILQAYGVDTTQVMRPLNNRPSPNSWFRAIGYMDPQGRVTQETNKAGATEGLS